MRVTGAEANFYLHEIAEGTLRARGMAYDAAHAAALEKYGVSNFSLYRCSWKHGAVHEDNIRSGRQYCACEGQTQRWSISMTSKEEARRLDLVHALLAMTIPIAEITKQLAAMNWDYEGAGVELNRTYLTNALQRYLQGEISEADIELWANQIEGRDDVRFEVGFEEEIEEVLYELANPLLTQKLVQKRAREIVKSLNLSR